MSNDHYQFSCDALVILDSELDIQLQLPCSLPRLPFSREGKGIVQQKDQEGRLLAAFFAQGNLRHGECHLFFEEGALRSEMFYLEGQLHGPCMTYAQTGTLLSKTWYREGKKIGKAQFYSLSGALVSLQRFKNGQWEGMQEYFYEDGRSKSLIPFLDGKLHGKVALFWENGKPKREVHYKNGCKEGSDTLWNQEGIVIDEGTYLLDQPLGVHRHYFRNGVLKEERRYHTARRFDCKEWSITSELLLEGSFSPDLTYTEKRYLSPEGPSVRKGVWHDNRIQWQ